MGASPIIRVRLHRYADRPIGLIWRHGQRSGEVSSGERDVKLAERAAGRLEEQLLAGVIPGRSEGLAITWADFRARYELEWLESLSYGSQKGWAVAANHFERLCGPVLLIDVTKSMLSRFRGELEAMGVSPASVRSYYRALRAGLGWAESIDLIDSVPTIRHRRRVRESRGHRGRVPTLEEFERMLCVTPIIRPHDHREFVAFMRGLWLSGLRIDELNRLKWERSATLHVLIEPGTTPLIVILKQKGGRDSFLPAPPDFWRLIDRPGVVRRGHVFSIPGKHAGEQMSTRTIGRRIGEIGRHAGVIVDHHSGKCCTAHDLRAAYLSRIASTPGVTMSQTQTMARHSDPKTTSQYYVRHEAEDLARAMGWH